MCVWYAYVCAHLEARGKILCELFSVSLHSTPLQGFSLKLELGWQSAGASSPWATQCWSYTALDTATPAFWHKSVNLNTHPYTSSGWHSKRLFICWVAIVLTSGFYCVFVLRQSHYVSLGKPEVCVNQSGLKLWSPYSQILGLKACITIPVFYKWFLTCSCGVFFYLSIFSFETLLYFSISLIWE